VTDATDVLGVPNGMSMDASVDLECPHHHSTHRACDVCWPLLTVYFGTPNMFVTLWFGFVYGTNLPLGTLII
jgi:hypothetical protein